MTGLHEDTNHDVAGIGVTLTICGSLAVITFRRAPLRNAMRLRDWLELPTLIEAAEQDSAVSVILLRGAGGNFGSGNDISEFGALRRDPSLALSFGRAMGRAMAAVESASKPVVVGIEGVCYGASVALALAGDLRVAAEKSVFAITPAKLGALYLRSDLHRLTAAIGNSQARKMIFTAREVKAPEALQLGLIDDIYLPETFDAQLQSLIASIDRGSRFTLRRSKELLLNLNDVRAPSETEESLSWFVQATQGPDFAEGVEAFLKKRPPRFANLRPPEENSGE